MASSRRLGDWETSAREGSDICDWEGSVGSELAGERGSTHTTVSSSSSLSRRKKGCVRSSAAEGRFVARRQARMKARALPSGTREMPSGSQLFVTRRKIWNWSSPSSAYGDSFVIISRTHMPKAKMSTFSS